MVYITLTSGTLSLFAAPGTWMSGSCAVWSTLPGDMFAAFWCVECVFAFRGTCLRLSAENRALRETGDVLVKGGYPNLGAFVAEALKEGEKARQSASQDSDVDPLCEVVLERVCHFFQFTFLRCRFWS